MVLDIINKRYNLFFLWNTIIGDYMYYLNLYFIGSFIGYLYETILKYTISPSINNGLLHGPWIPVYGFGVVFSSYLSNKVFSIKKGKIIRMLLTFSLIFVIVTITEEIGGLFIQILFHRKFWNYKRFIFNIGPYISLETSLLWCLLSFIFIFYLKPFLELFIKKIPKFLSFGIGIFQLIDLSFTLLV